MLIGTRSLSYSSFADLGDVGTRGTDCMLFDWDWGLRGSWRSQVDKGGRYYLGTWYWSSIEGDDDDVSL